MLPATHIVRPARILLLIICVAISATTARAGAQGEPDAETLIKSFRHAADAATRDELFDRIDDRREDGTLSNDQIRTMVDALLEAQQDPDDWDLAWDTFVENARELELVSDESLAQYRRQVRPIMATVLQQLSTEKMSGRMAYYRAWYRNRQQFGDATAESDGQLIDALLARQADPTLSWYEEDGDDFVAWRRSGRLSDQQWRDFLRNMVQIRISQSGSLPLGFPPRLNADVTIRTIASRQFLCTVFHEGTTIDGKAHWRDLKLRHFFNTTNISVRAAWWNSRGKSRGPATVEQFAARMNSDFRPDAFGAYDLRSAWRVRVVDVGIDLATKTMLPILEHDIDPQSLTDEPIGDVIEFPIVIEQTIEVRPNRDAKWIDDPAWEAKIRDALIERSAHGINGSVGRPVPPDDDPFVGKLDFYFDVYAVIDGNERYIGEIYQVATPSDDPLWDEENERPYDVVFQMHRKWDAPNMSSRGHRLPERADLILKPNRFIPTLWTHDTSAWGGEIRLEDVRLHRW